MTIDWITVSAQIVNFLILVWLLKRFLYQPVMRAMDRREQRIAERINEAVTREQNAEEEARRYQDKSNELERRRDEILAEAREDAGHEKLQLLEGIREEVTETRSNWQRQANLEKEEFLDTLRYQTTETIQAIARKALSDLANADLEERVVHMDVRKRLAGATEPVRLASTFELDAAMRGRITRAIHEHIADGLEVNYIQSPELLCGVELTGGGQRLAWSLADYLEELDTRIEEAFVPTQQAAKAE
jgi:F-type H+-transporting ATPase subunit b